MTSTQTVTLELPSEVAAQIQDAVESGDFASAGEVVTDALRGWTANLERENLQSLPQICQDSIKDHQQGLDPEPVFARLGQRFQALVDVAALNGR